MKKAVSPAGVYCDVVVADKTRLKTVKVEGTNMLGVVTFSIAMAVAINNLEENRGRPLKEFFNSLSEASILLVRAAIWSVLLIQ